MPMPDDVIREHITATAERDARETWRLTRHLLAGLWPGGPHDRDEPTAHPWLRQWRPAQAAVPLPRCSCATGACPVCN